jgi:hypothetical protein
MDAEFKAKTRLKKNIISLVLAVLVTFGFIVKKCGATVIKKKIKFSSYIRKFRMEQSQSHI